MRKCQVPLQNPIFIQGEVPETQVSCFLYIINYFRLWSEDILHGFSLTMDSYLSIVWHTCPSFDIVTDRIKLRRHNYFWYKTDWRNMK